MGTACASPRSTTRGSSTPIGCRSPSRWSGAHPHPPEEVAGELQRQWQGPLRSGTTPTTSNRRCRSPARPIGCWRSKTSSPAGSPSSTPGCTGGGASPSRARTRPRRGPSRCWICTAPRSRSSTPRRSTATRASSSPASRSRPPRTAVAARSRGAVPAATASGGDRRGIMIGAVGTCTATRRPVAWDPWLAQEVRARFRPHRRRRRAGLGEVVPHRRHRLQDAADGAPGGPCSTPQGRWPSSPGPQARLFARHGRADPGILNPYRVVAAEHFADEEDPERAWRRERSLAAATRLRLVLDGSPPPGLPFDVARLPHTRIVLLRAVREVGGSADRHPGLVPRAAATSAMVRTTRCCRRLPGGAPRAAAGRAAVPRHESARPVELTATTVSPS